MSVYPNPIDPDTVLEVADMAVLMSYFRRAYDDLKWYQWFEQIKLGAIIDAYECTYTWLMNGKPNVGLDIIYLDENGRLR